MDFVGRREQLAELDRWYRRVARERRGLMLAVRGRRQVGKSTLYTEFLRRGRVPHLFFTAVKDGSARLQLERFAGDARDSTPPLPNADVLFRGAPESWADAFGRVRLAAQEGPVAVVLDEFPWAAEADPTLEGELQRAWDRDLQRLPVLLVLIGSDVTMMERLTEHDRPLYGRAREDEVHAFHPGEVAEALGKPNAIDIFDAYLATGGYPKLVDELARAGSLRRYVTAGMADENSDLVVVAQRSLDAELPPSAQARRVVSAIGGQDVGHATFTSVFARLGGEPAGKTAITRALHLLRDQKGVVDVVHPAGARLDSKVRRYRITDPYLRFWFRYVEPHVANIARGRSDLAVAAFDADWSSWRGRAIEPEVHAALERLAPHVPPLRDAAEVGSWWNRDGSVEVDIAALDREQKTVALGSIKWRQRRKVTAGEVRALASARDAVPRASHAALIVVCPAGCSTAATGDVDLVLTADDLLGAWT